MSELTVRDATSEDFERINEIYNWTIVDNHVSFDTEPYDLEKRQEWWDGRDADLDCLVAEADGLVIGVAYSSRYRPKAAYRSTVETTVVIDIDHLGRGVGTALLTALVNRLQAAGHHLAVAIVALPNDASVALHHRIGYQTAGVIHEVGHKDGKYWDTMLLERRLPKQR